MSEIDRWQITPSRSGFFIDDDWHHGFNDFDSKKFPEHLENKLYMMGWMRAMGMFCGYENLPASLNEAEYVEGWQSAQHERYCHNQETIIKFEDD